MPKAAFQLSVLFDVVPCTVALNGSVPPVTEDADAGDMMTELTPPAFGPAVTVTVAVAVLLGSALLVTVIVTVPKFEGAV